MFTEIVICGLFQFIVSQIVHVLIWRTFSPKAYPIWLPVIFIGTPVAIFIILHILVFIRLIGLDLNDAFYLTIGSSFIMHISLSAMYIHMYPGIIFFSPSLEVIKLLAERKGTGLSIEEIDLPVLSESNTIDMRINHLIKSGMIAENSNQLFLTKIGYSVAKSFYLYRRMLGLPGIGRG